MNEIPLLFTKPTCVITALITIIFRYWIINIATVFGLFYHQLTCSGFWLLLFISNIAITFVFYVYWLCSNTHILPCVTLVQRWWRWTTVCSCPTCRPRGTTCCCSIPERSSSWTWSSARQWAWWPLSALGCHSCRWGAILNCVLHDNG